jgi:hypothetical protein
MSLLSSTIFVPGVQVQVEFHTDDQTLATFIVSVFLPGRMALVDLHCMLECYVLLT